MFRRLAMLLLALPLALPATAVDASAAGIGIYGGARFGVADWEMDEFEAGDPNSQFFGFDLQSDGDLKGFRGGLVVETAPKRKKVFSYRFNIGYEAFRADWDRFDLDLTTYATMDRMQLAGASMEHTFGFGVLRLDVFRLWLGPRIKLGYYAGELEDGEVDLITGDTLDIALFEGGIAPMAGANVNIGSVVTLGVAAGYMWSAYAGVIGDIGDEDTDITGGGSDGFVTAVLMFRTGPDR